MKKEKLILGLTKEEAQNRKQELLSIINQYNEDLILERETQYSDEEIEEFSEELETLNYYTSLTKEEKLAKLDDDKVVVNEDGTVTEKKTVLDSVNPLVIIIGILCLAFACGIISLSVGRDFIKSYIKGVYDKALNDGFTDYYSYSSSKYCYKPFWFWTMAVIGVAIVPFVMSVISFVTYIVTKKIEIKKQSTTKINTKITFVFFILTVVAMVISTVFIMLFGLKPDLDIYMEIPNDCFWFYYYYQEIALANI